MAGKAGGQIWGETFLAEITKLAGSNLKIEGVSSFDTLNITFGDKTFESIVLANAGRLQRMVPEGPCEITFEAYVLEAASGDLTSATTLTGFFDLISGDDNDTSQPFRLLSSTIRNRFRMTITWTEDTALVSAAGELTNGNEAFRLAVADGFITNVVLTTGDNGALKTTVTFRADPFDSFADPNYLFESVAGTGTITTLANYTGSSTSNTKF